MSSLHCKQFDGYNTDSEPTDIGDMRLVIIVWADITKRTNDNEFDENMDIDSRLEKLTTVGLLYKETEKNILLVQEFWYVNGKKIPRDWVIIPKSQIVKME